MRSSFRHDDDRAKSLWYLLEAAYMRGDKLAIAIMKSIEKTKGSTEGRRILLTNESSIRGLASS